MEIYIAPRPPDLVEPSAPERSQGSRAPFPEGNHPMPGPLALTDQQFLAEACEPLLPADRSAFLVAPRREDHCSGPVGRNGKMALTTA
jgi:hypothetical protein